MIGLTVTETAMEAGWALACDWSAEQNFSCSDWPAGQNCPSSLKVKMELQWRNLKVMKIVSDWTTGNGELILLDRRPSDLISLYNISHRQNTLQRQDTALYNHTITTLLIVRTTTYDKTSIQHHQTPNLLHIHQIPLQKSILSWLDQTGNFTNTKLVTSFSIFLNTLIQIPIFNITRH
jgi:hypothetical protein